MSTVAVGMAGAALLAACTAPAPSDSGVSRAPGSTVTPSSSAAGPPTSAPAPADPAPPSDGVTPTARPPRAPDVGTAVDTVRHLAGRIGPRPATGPAYRRAAAWVQARFQGWGYRVSRQRVRVPGGVSWGVPVSAGRSTSVVATPAGFDPTRPHLVVGAHLDTVPQAPGAEDNASGVGVLLAVAEAIAGRRTRLPVVLVAFGAEEPRGPSDDDHHYGSRHYVAGLIPAERRALRAMVSLDRVGVGSVVPVCSATGLPDPDRRPLVRAAARAGVPVAGCVSRASDHWSFVHDGLPGVRIGGTSYAGYHSPGDVPSVVERAQLRRVARLVVTWLAPRATTDPR